MLTPRSRHHNLGVQILVAKNRVYLEGVKKKGGGRQKKKGERERHWRMWKDSGEGEKRRGRGGDRELREGRVKVGEIKNLAWCVQQTKGLQVWERLDCLILRYRGAYNAV